MRCCSQFLTHGMTLLLTQLLIISVPTLGSKSSSEKQEWKKEFRNHLVVPDVINRVPYSLLSIDYGQGSVDTGATLSRSSIEEAPKLEWSVEEGEFYTLFIVNPDVPNRREPIEAEWQHMTVYNLRNNNLKSGDVTVEYSAHYSHRLKTGLQRIVFLVFKQQGKVNVSHMKIWNSSTHRTPDGNSRGDIHIKTFAKTRGFIKPIAGNFFYVSDKEKDIESGTDSDASSLESLNDGKSCESISDCKQSYVCIQNECKVKRKRSAGYEEDEEESSEDTALKFDNRVKDHRNFLGQYKYPSICHQGILGNCSYLARWFSTDKAQVIEFLIQTRNRNLTGIGFNNKKELPKSDFILAKKEENSIQDAHIQDPSYVILDKEDDLRDKSSKMKGNVWEISFSRRLGATNEKEDVDLSSPKGVYIYVPRFVRSESTLRSHDVIFSHIPYNFRFAYKKNLKKKEKEANQGLPLPEDDEKEIDSEPSSFENEPNSSDRSSHDSGLEEPKDEYIDSTTELPLNQTLEPMQSRTSREENADERELDYDSESYESSPYYEDTESNETDDDDGSRENKSSDSSSKDSKETLNYEEPPPKFNQSANNNVNKFQRSKEYRKGELTSELKDSLEDNLKSPGSSEDDYPKNTDENLSRVSDGKSRNKDNYSIEKDLSTIEDFSGSKEFKDDEIRSLEDLESDDKSYPVQGGEGIDDIFEKAGGKSTEDRLEDTELSLPSDDDDVQEGNKTHGIDNVPSVDVQTSEEDSSGDNTIRSIEAQSTNSIQEEYDSLEKKNPFPRHPNDGNDLQVGDPGKVSTHLPQRADKDLKDSIQPQLENRPSDNGKGKDVTSNVEIPDNLVTPGTGQGKSPFPISSTESSIIKLKEEENKYFEHVMEDNHILKYPPYCQDTECGMIAKWKSNERKGVISFEVTCSKKEQHPTCGIGFSVTKDIRNSDYLEMEHGRSSDNYINNNEEITPDEEESLFDPVKGHFDSFKFERDIIAQDSKEDVSFNKGPLWVYCFLRPKDGTSGKEKDVVFTKYPIDFVSKGKHEPEDDNEESYSKYSETLSSATPKGDIKFPIEIKANGVYIRISPNGAKNQKQVDVIINRNKKGMTKDYSQEKQALDLGGVTPLSEDVFPHHTTSRIKDILNQKGSSAKHGTDKPSLLIDHNDGSKLGTRILRKHSLSKNNKQCFDDNVRTNSFNHSFNYFLECRNGVYKLQKCPQVAVFWKLLQCCVHITHFPCQSHCLN